MYLTPENAFYFGDLMNFWGGEFYD